MASGFFVSTERRMQLSIGVIRGIVSMVRRSTGRAGATPGAFMAVMRHCPIDPIRDRSV